MCLDWFKYKITYAKLKKKILVNGVSQYAHGSWHRYVHSFFGMKKNLGVNNFYFYL